MIELQEPVVSAELVAVLVAVTDGEPRVLTTDAGQALPAGPFQQTHRSLQTGLRDWVEAQTHHPVGYVEQLYTFADRDRFDAHGARVVSVSYVGLTREVGRPDVAQVIWQDCYRYFPWEDWRQGAPELIRQVIGPALAQWCAQEPELEAMRRQRVLYSFGLEGATWNEDFVLQRYELLYEAGLLPEARRRREPRPDAVGQENRLGLPMMHDHRRILATGLARLRAKIKYRPVVFELMPPEFTLLQLQQAVEALAGRGLHKQNFRRLIIEQQALVEETGGISLGGSGRPAKLFRFRGDVLLERAISGSKLPLAKQAR
ncbi:NUDIX hydrolase [Alcaligenes sp. SDU_A2]|uniref:NUDIX hydrolase n=1 Tax=Alcaligenes sp. SDU_A2 TaxID=3136634 RepID=UPI00311D4B4C